MNRSDLQRLAEIRLSDAKALLATGVNDAGAYYIAGYAVECAIKACIAKNQGEYPFPEKISDKDLREKYYTHSLSILLNTADLVQQMGIDSAANPDLSINWIDVQTWSENYRYQVSISRPVTENLIRAIEDPQNGVLTWLKRYW